MKKQTEHVREYKSGAVAVINPGNKKIVKSTFGSKLIPNRYLILREIGAFQPPWKSKHPEDMDKSYYTLVEFGHYPSSPFGDADKDKILNIFDKRPLDPRVRKTVPPTIKKGNSKLTKVIGIFSLPRFYTCPGRTPLCEKYCYAEPPERFRPAVVYSRNKNLAWTMRRDFVSVLSRMITNFNVPYFRVHESGDFYNQKYLEKWIQIAKNNPQTRFLAYTKNWMLDFSDVPENFTMRYSSDVSSKKVRGDLPACYVGPIRPKQFFTCLGKCEPGFCMACWDRKIDVFIPIHSIGKDKVDHMFFKQFSPEVPEEIASRPKGRYKNLNIMYGRSKR